MNNVQSARRRKCVTLSCITLGLALQSPTVISAQQPSAPTTTQAQREAPPQALKIYHLRNIQANEAASVVTQVLTTGRRDLRVAVDARTNALIVSAAAELQSEIEALLMQLDEHNAGAATPAAGLPSVQVRVYWLVSSDGANPLPERLQPVVAELESLGVADLKLGGQMAVNVGRSGRPFSVTGRQNLEGHPYKLQFEGVLTAEDGRAPSLEARIHYGSARDENDARMGSIDTTIEAPLNQFVVLGSTDIGLSNSVFVLQVVPRSEAASKK